MICHTTLKSTIADPSGPRPDRSHFFGLRPRPSLNANRSATTTTMSAHTAGTAVQLCLLPPREKESVGNGTTLEVGAETVHEIEIEATQGNVAHPVARVTHPGVHAEHPIAAPEAAPGLPKAKGKEADRNLEAAAVETRTLADQEAEGALRVEGARFPPRPVNHSALTSSKALATEGRDVDSVMTSLGAGINPPRLAVLHRRL
jgi:hypothetical protein